MKPPFELKEPFFRYSTLTGPCESIGLRPLRICGRVITRDRLVLTLKYYAKVDFWVLLLDKNELPTIPL